MTGSEPGSKLMMILLPWSGLVRSSLPGLNAHDIQASQSREIITEKSSEFYTLFFMKSAIDWRKSCDWRKTPGFLRKSEIFPVVIV